MSSRADRITETPLADGVRIDVRQRRFDPLLRWAGFALAFGLLGSAYALALGWGLPPGWIWRTTMIGIGLVLFVAALAAMASAFTVLAHVLGSRGNVSFDVRSLGIARDRPLRRGHPRAMHRDELAGPFVRVDDVIDPEASAATIMRDGGEAMATMLAEGARAGVSGGDTLTGWFHAGSNAAVTVTWRGFDVPLAESLMRAEAEDLAHRIALVLERTPR